MNDSRNLSISRRLVSLVFLLVALFVASVYVPFPVSWLVHCLFTFTLTLLVYKNLLNSSHTNLFLFGMILLMALWEVFEWAIGIGSSDSAFLTGLDTALDLVFGLLGTIVGIKKSRTPRAEQ